MALAGQRFFMSATAITFALVSLLIALCLAAPLVFNVLPDEGLLLKCRMIDNAAYFDFPPQQYRLLEFPSQPDHEKTSC